MLKPKNINIKKLTHPEIQPDSKNRHSRKSLKMPKRQLSPSNFIACINGYLNQLDEGKQSRMKSREQLSEIQQVKRKIRKQKSINRSMQKNIIEFQRILWERTEKLDILQDIMKNLQNKQNNKSLANSSMHGKVKQKIGKKTQIKQVSSQFENLPSDESQSEIHYDNLDRYRKRRKTQMPTEIQKMISRTIAMLPEKEMRKKY